MIKNHQSYLRQSTYFTGFMMNRHMPMLTAYLMLLNTIAPVWPEIGSGK